MGKLSKRKGAQRRSFFVVYTATMVDVLWLTFDGKNAKAPKNIVFRGFIFLKIHQQSTIKPQPSPSTVNHQTSTIRALA